MSFLRDIEAFQKSAALRRVATDTVTLDGRRIRQETDGTSHVVTHGDAGFVEDTEPDLQVGEVWPGLFLGSQDVAANVDQLSSLGITHIINVAVGIDNFFPERFTYLNIELLDLPETDLLAVLPTCIDFIQNALDCEEKAGVLKVFVHCNAGVSRSAAVCTGYIMTVSGKSLSEALSVVKEERPCARPNEGFTEQLRRYEKTLQTQTYHT